MNKIQMGPQTWLYPMPVLLVGANVDGKANFMPAAWGGVANGEPPMVSIALRHSRHTRKGIMQNMVFSINVPSTDLVREADYCGLVSGSKVDKVQACKFKIFYGKLGNVPLLEQCPVNLECTVMHILNLGSHSLIVGKIEETHISESCLSDGKPAVSKIKPLIFSPAPSREDHTLGEIVGTPFSIGKEISAKP